MASVFIFVTGVPALNAYLKSPALNVPLPVLHNQVLKVPPVAPKPTPEAAVLDLNFVALPGTAVVLATFLVAPFLGMPFGRTARVFGAHDAPAGAVADRDLVHGRRSPTSPSTPAWTRCSA